MRTNNDSRSRPGRAFASSFCFLNVRSRTGSRVRVRSLPERTANCGLAATDRMSAGPRLVMTFTETIQFLQSLNVFGMNPGLANTLKLAGLAGNPQERLRFIHV